MRGLFRFLFAGFCGRFPWEELEFVSFSSRIDQSSSAGCSRFTYLPAGAVGSRERGQDGGVLDVSDGVAEAWSFLGVLV